MGEMDMPKEHFNATEYLALDKQLDSLNTALDVLEKRSDNLQEETQRFLRDARATRGEVPPGEMKREEGEEAKMDGTKEESKGGEKESGLETD